MGMMFSLFFWGFLITFSILYYRNLCIKGDSGDWIFTPDQIIIQNPDGTIPEPEVENNHDHEYTNKHTHEYDSSHIPIEWFMWSDL